MSPDVSLPQFDVLGHRQRIIEASLSSGNYSRWIKINENRFCSGSRPLLLFLSSCLTGITLKSTPVFSMMIVQVVEKGRQRQDNSWWNCNYDGNTKTAVGDNTMITEKKFRWKWQSRQGSCKRLCFQYIPQSIIILYLIVYKRCSESVECVVVEGGRNMPPPPMPPIESSESCCYNLLLP